MRCMRFIPMCNELLPLGQQSPDTACRPLILPLSFSFPSCMCMHRHTEEGAAVLAPCAESTQCVSVTVSVTAHFRMDSSRTGNGAWPIGQRAAPEVKGKAVLLLLYILFLQWAQLSTAEEELQQGCLLSMLWEIPLENCPTRDIPSCHDSTWGQTWWIPPVNLQAKELFRRSGKCRDIHYFQTQCCQYFPTSEPSDTGFSYGLCWKKLFVLHFIWFAMHILHCSLFRQGSVSARVFQSSFLDYCYSVSQIKLLCQDTTKMLLCLWHLCSSCWKHLFDLHFFPFFHCLECRNSSTSSF